MTRTARVSRRAALGLLAGSAGALGLALAGCGTGNPAHHPGTAGEPDPPSRAGSRTTPETGSATESRTAPGTLGASGSGAASGSGTAPGSGTASGSGTGVHSTADPERDTEPPAPVKIPYGPDSSQYGELHLPSGTRRPGTVVILHGGFWRSEYGAELGTPLAVDLARRGWVVWNLEYRRVGNGGGWPATFLDVAAGVDELTPIAIGGQHGAIDISRVVAIGHSAGGQLAAWLASRSKPQPPNAAPSELTAAVGGGGRKKSRVRVTGVISQAGVLDLKGAAESGVGGAAVPDLMGGTFEQVAGRFRSGDPIEQLPIGVPVHCVHGVDDFTVPFEQSSAYVDAARRAGDPAVLHRVDGDHFTLIDPSSKAWRTVTDLVAHLTS